MLGRFGQRLELLGRLAVMDEIPALDLEDDFVDRIEQVGDAPGQPVFDQRDLVHVRRLSKKHRHDWARRLEGRIQGSHREEVLEDADELTEVRVHPIASGAFALFDDDLDCRARRREVGDRGQRRPLEDLGRRLRCGRPDEDGGLAIAIDQVGEPGLDAPVEVADGVPLLGARRDLRFVDREGLHRSDRAKAFRISQRHAFGTLQEHEVAERPLPEGDQGDLDIRWIPAREDREIGPLEMGRGAERAQDVGGQGQVQHFLLDDVDQGQLPGLDAGQLPCGDAFLNAPLQRKLGVEVLAEQAVLEFAGLTEQVDELLPALNSQGRFGEGPVRRPGSWHTDIVAGRRLNTRCIGRGMAENERIPADFHQAMFRIAAIAFVTAATVDVGSSYIGAPHLDFTGIWIIGILSYVGAVVSWFFPWHRLPVERFLVVIVVPGLVLLGFMLMATGGVNSHILPIFIAPAVFMAAAYGFRAGSAIAVLTAATASLPLFLNGWDSYYGRTLVVLAVATMLCAYISARVPLSLLNEYETPRRPQEESYVATIGAPAAAPDAKNR